MGLRPIPRGTPGPRTARSAGFLVGALLLSLAGDVLADDSPPPTSADALEHVIARPHTIAELEGGIIALPNAPISAAERGGNTPLVGKIGHGDATAQIGVHVLYRFNREYILGAGAIFAPSPTSDQQYGGLSSLSRSHSRSYFFLGIEGRYIPFRYKQFEGWVGLSMGGVVVADRFSTDAPPVHSDLEVPDVTIRTRRFRGGGTGRRDVLPQRELDRGRKSSRISMGSPRNP